MRVRRLLALLVVATSAIDARGAALVIRKARLVDGTGAPARDGVSILVRDGRIAAIAPDVAAGDATLLDVAGATVLPGLMDAHVHFVAAPGSAFRKDSAETLRRLNRRHLRAYLACGVTTVLDAGIDPAVARDLQADLAAGAPGPRFLTTGPYVRPPNGYGWVHFHGWQTPREIELVGAAGIPPMDVLLAATRRPEEMLGIAADVGTVEVGKRADLVVVRGDPLADLRALRRVAWTIRDGIAHTPVEWMEVGSMERID